MRIRRCVHAEPTVLPSGTEIMARMMQASSQQRIYETPKEGRVSHASRINYLRVACVYHSLYMALCVLVRFKVPFAEHISHPHPPPQPHILLPSLYYMCEVR